MNYYIIEPDLENYYPVGPQNNDDLHMILEHIDEPTKFSTWQPIIVEILSEDNDEENGRSNETSKTEALADLMDFNATFINVISERGKQHLSNFFNESGELLPVILNSERYYIHHVTKVLDALDLNKSEVERFSSGRLMRVIKYVLKENIVDNHDIFRLIGVKRLVFASERFVHAVKEGGLLGFKFVPVEINKQ